MASAPDLETTGAPPPAVLVRTTLPRSPLPPNDQRPHIRTPRLLLRPLTEDDLDGMHALRTQPEAMTGTARGVPDMSVQDTRTAMEFFLPPHDAEQYLFGIFWAATSVLIGEGGVHNLESGSSGWPEIGYKLRKEYWGMGIGSEFLRAFVDAWWQLPRDEEGEVVLRRVHCDSLEGVQGANGSRHDEAGEGGTAVEAVEQVYANTDWDNIGSQRVLEKVGFVKFTEWTEPETRINLQGQMSRLYGYRLARPRIAAA